MELNPTLKRMRRVENIIAQKEEITSRDCLYLSPFRYQRICDSEPINYSVWKPLEETDFGHKISQLSISAEDIRKLGYSPEDPAPELRGEISEDNRSLTISRHTPRKQKDKDDAKRYASRVKHTVRPGDDNW